MAGTSRRSVLRLVGLGAIFSVVILRPWDRLARPEIAFDPIPDLPPFRYLAGERRRSGGGAVDWMTIGLAPNAVGEDGAEAPMPVSALCRTLIGDWRTEGPVPVTYFTDMYCPNCRAQERELAALDPEIAQSITLTTREFPVFGAASTLAAQAILAAALQGAGEAMRALLQRSAPVRSAEALAERAASIGMDPVRFLADVASAVVAERLTLDRALARRLGLPGTPSLVVGRSVVIGVLDARSLGDLVRREVEDQPATCPAG
jgi:predicted DsbA family dithiol-disulfide isomerase